MRKDILYHLIFDSGTKNLSKHAYDVLGKKDGWYLPYDPPTMF